MVSQLQCSASKMKLNRTRSLNSAIISKNMSLNLTDKAEGTTSTNSKFCQFLKNQLIKKGKVMF